MTAAEESPCAKKTCVKRLERKCAAEVKERQLLLAELRDTRRAVSRQL